MAGGSRRARVMVLGFDAMDPMTARALIGDGELPTFGRLLESALRAPIRTPYGFFINNLWTSLYTGWRPSRTRYHCWEEIVAGTYTHRLTPFEKLQGAPFWRSLVEAGRRVAVIDVPHSVAEAAGDGIQVSEWGAHDRHLGLRVFPESEGPALLERFGLHPILGVDGDVERTFAPDDYVLREGALRTTAEERALLEGLLAGAAIKERLSTSILERGGWDLFLSVFSEGHATGHQQWHIHDRAHPRHEPSVRHELGDPVAAVYRRLDGVLARHLALADSDTVVLVLLSHGMGPKYDGTRLLTEVLRRLDAPLEADRLRTEVARAARACWSLVPERARPAAGRLGARLVRQRLRMRDLVPVAEHAGDEDRARQRFFNSPNNDHIGGVRLNLRHREPEGRVSPGREADAEMERIRAALLELVNLDTGAPAVRRVERSDDHYTRSSGDSFPDLFVDWNHDAPIDTVWSPRVGIVHRPYTHWRSGDHRRWGLLLATGPGLRRGGDMPPVDALDVAPTVAALLGVELDDVDGISVPWLAASSGGDRRVGRITTPQSQNRAPATTAGAGRPGTTGVTAL